VSIFPHSGSADNGDEFARLGCELRLPTAV